MPVRVREAESIKVAAFPKPLAFRNWKSALRQEVAAASGRPGEAFKWLQATDCLSLDPLADPGKFPTLDTKLGAGLQKAARGDRADPHHVGRGDGSEGWAPAER